MMAKEELSRLEGSFFFAAFVSANNPRTIEPFFINHVYLKLFMVSIV